jgi:cytochrome c553
MRRPIRVFCLLLVLTACSTAVPVRYGAHARSAQPVTFSDRDFADGDPAEGRRAFIVLQCINCHRVAEDPELPRGPRTVEGPLLSGLDRYSSRELAERITSRSKGADDTLTEQAMEENAKPITARNLVDLIAYLRSLKVRPA